MTRTAVHFGAGNIGRGFIGLLLHQSGYDLVFSDVNAALVAELNAAESYRVQEVGAHPKVHRVEGFRAVDSARNADAAIAAVASADIVTCAVGAGVLKFIAPVIRAGLAARAHDAAPLIVVACENVINATDLLRADVLDGAPELASRAVFANTAVDRIIPAVHGDGLDVVVEDFSEWVIERGPFAGAEPRLIGARFVDDLAPFIQRKLFTVNTGHATAAYWGWVEGEPSIASALANPRVRAEVDAVLAETSALLVERFGFDPAVQARYATRTIERFENPELPDTPLRIGRHPPRKLGRNERFVQPAHDLAARGMPHGALVAAIGAALRFSDPGDAQAVELQQRLSGHSAEAFVQELCGLRPGQPLYADLVAAVTAAQQH